jgi:hypothetical protein
MRKVFVLLAVLAALCAASQRMVALEGFTNYTCPSCPSADAAWEAIASQYHDHVILTEWHMNWPGGSDPFYLYNPVDQNNRKSHYGVNFVPDTYVDGTQVHWSAAAAYVADRIDVPSPMEIVLTGNITGNDGYFDARFEWTDTAPDHFYRVYFIIIESDLSAGGRHYNYTMRITEPDYPGWLLPDNTGVHYHIQEFDVDPIWKSDDLIGYVIVQDFQTKQVVQCARVDLGEWQSRVEETSWGQIKAMNH